jgi:hypothetical protein
LDKYGPVFETMLGKSGRRGWFLNEYSEKVEGDLIFE